MVLKELASFLDTVVPLSLQESYDNSGLQVGLPDQTIDSALLSLDITEDVVDEAIEKGCDIIISHHPLIFRPIKSIAGRSSTERIIQKAIENRVAIYSSHTNLDAMDFGVSRKMAEKLDLEKVTVLSPLRDRLCKLTTFIPISHIEKVRNAIFGAGAGVLENYDSCGFMVEGTGSFCAGKGSNPFVGEEGRFHEEREARFETILFRDRKDDVIRALIDSHPYEEVAYDIHLLENDNIGLGAGCVGFLPKEMLEISFLEYLSSVFGANGIRYSNPGGKEIRKVALCGGSGSDLLDKAISIGADVFVTADVKYHTFSSATNRILLVDIGHYESEKFSVEILYSIINKKFPNFALLFSGVNPNPINYL